MKSCLRNTLNTEALRLHDSPLFLNKNDFLEIPTDNLDLTLIKMDKGITYTNIKRLDPLDLIYSCFEGFVNCTVVMINTSEAKKTPTSVNLPASSNILATSLSQAGETRNHSLL